MQAKKQQLEPDMEQRTGFKLGKEYVKAVYCHPACLTYIQRTSWETLGWMKHKLESRLPGEISVTSDMQVIPSLWQKVKRKWRASWWKGKRKVKTLTWNSTFKKLRSWHLVPSLHGKLRGKSGVMTDFFSLGLQNHCNRDCSLEIKRQLFLWR